MTTIPHLLQIGDTLRAVNGMQLNFLPSKLYDMLAGWLAGRPKQGHRYLCRVDGPSIVFGTQGNFLSGKTLNLLLLSSDS